MIACPRCGHPNSEGARYCSNCALELAAVAPQAELRKTVTVMFMDAADSTGIGERTDPEAMRRVMSRYFGEIRAIVERHGGVIEKYIGDAVMAVFGVPAVHEDDALRAVRAAAEIRSRVRELSEQLELERGLSIGWRTGVNTGEVVAGDAGSGQRFVSGDAVNVAARLEQAAAPGEVLIGAETYGLVRDVVSVEPVAPVAAKGKSEPIPVYRLTGVAPGASAPPRRLAAAMVGRQRQQRLLSDAFEQVVEEGICHLFTILGAAGVGKSRLVSEFIGSLDASVHVLHGRCLSYGEGITMWPIVEAIRQAAGLGELDDDAVIRDKIGALIDDDRDREMVVQRIGGLFGQSSGGAAAEETYWAVRTLLQSLARRAPVVLHLDDIHWAEEALLNLIDNLSEWTRDTPLLLVCVARQELLEMRPGWGGGKQHATTLTLEPLSEAETAELMENLLGRVDSSPELATRIAAAAEGNPLFVEEMVGMLIDQGALVRGADGWAPAGDLGKVAVPPTIQALLAARLDRLSRSERAVIERGAIEGKIFHRGAVAELAPDDVRASVGEHLRSLSRKELVRPDRSDFAGDEAFRFRHLLIRDAAYSAMPKEARAALHARFARWLTRTAGGNVGEYEAILGYHLEQAYRYRAELGPLDAEARALGAEAADRLASSGRRAAQRGDVHAASKLFRSATDVAPIDHPDRSMMVAELGTALVLVGEPRAASELLAVEGARFAEAGDEIGRVRIEVVRLASETTLATMNIKQVIAECERLLALAEASGDSFAASRVAFELARHQFFAGRARLAEEQLTALLIRYPGAEAPPQAIPLRLAAMFWGPRPVQEAVGEAEILLAGARTRLNETVALRILGGMHGLVGDFDIGRQLIRQSADQELELGRMFIANSTLGQFLGPLEMDAGNFAEAERLMLDSYTRMAAAGDRGFSASVAANLAYLYAVMGRWDDADEYVNICFATAADDDVEALAQGASLKARVLATRGEHEAAELAARGAVEMAEGSDYLQRRGFSWEQLGEVLAAGGKVTQAAEAIARAEAYYTAKGATFPAARARRRIDELGSSPGS
ncbi:MAG TPA: adenylate/guanylate cyclase domain-containing protein [Candidatus Limnocylindrales bacterium]|nr:adenylate/guanylate cyclase domain-containing protein [Candidatus Limnocylindrales bacterium]